MAYEDYNITIKVNKDDLYSINVGNTYEVQSVNRNTCEVTINRYKKSEFPNSLMTAEEFFEKIGRDSIEGIKD